MCNNQEKKDVWHSWGCVFVCVCQMRIRQPTQFPVEDHDVHYLLSHCARAELSTAGISQLSTHTTSQLMINRISFLVIKAITGDALWKATESAAIECTVSPRYISAYFLPKSIKCHVFNTCSQLELYRLHLTKHKLGKLPWFQFRLALSLCASFSYLIFLCVWWDLESARALGWMCQGLSCK